MKQRLKTLYRENTLFGVIILALATFFLWGTFPEKAEQTSKFLIPLFIVVVCLEIYFIRFELFQELSRISGQLDSQFIFTSFATGVDFDAYLENRLRDAQSLKVIHLGSYIAAEGKDRRYRQIVWGFLKSGGSFQRVICDPKDPKIIEWIRDELEAFKGQKFCVYYTSRIATDAVRTIGVVIIDEDEVVLGGSHDNPHFPKPLISTKNKKLAKFYCDYFDYLKDYSRPLESGDPIFGDSKK